MNYYRRYVGDYLRNTARLSLLEHGAYTLLLDYYYAEERPLPLDSEDVYRMVRAMSAEDRAAVDKIMRLYFSKGADGMHNGRADRELAVATKLIDTARENGKRGGRPRKAEDKTSEETQPVNQQETQRVTRDITRGQSQTEPVQNHPPSTNHHTPAANLQTPSASNSAPAQSSAEAATARGQMACALRAEGVKVTSGHPYLTQWVANGVTIQEAREAVDRARLKKPKPQQIPAAYLDPIIADVIQQRGLSLRSAVVTRIASAYPGRIEWWESDQGVKAEAAARGVPYEDPIKTKCRLAAMLGDGPWVDHRNATEIRLIEEFRKEAA